MDFRSQHINKTLNSINTILGSLYGRNEQLGRFQLCINNIYSSVTALALANIQNENQQAPIIGLSICELGMIIVDDYTIIKRSKISQQVASLSIYVDNDENIEAVQQKYKEWKKYYESRVLAKLIYKVGMFTSVILFINASHRRHLSGMDFAAGLFTASGLGLIHNMCSWNIKELQSFKELQRNILTLQKTLN